MMINNLNELKGLRFESFRVSRGSYTFEFEGKVNGEFVSLIVSTSDYVSEIPGSNSDLEAKSSLIMWPLLEKEIVSVEVNKTVDRSEVVLKFDSGLLAIWKNETGPGELLFIRNNLGKEWSVFL